MATIRALGFKAKIRVRNLLGFNDWDQIGRFWAMFGCALTIGAAGNTPSRRAGA
jgi:hypothetical protein